MPDAVIPEDLAESPVGQRLAFVLRHVRTSGRDLTDADLEAAFVMEQFRVLKIPIREGFAIMGRALENFELLSMRSPDATVALAAVDIDGRISDIGIRVQRQAPYKIRALGRAEHVPGLEVRIATDADGAALRDLELKVPIVLGETSVVYDRGDDYFAAERLMGDVFTYVVEREGEIVALTGSVVHKMRVNGSELLGSYMHRTRLLPEARGQRMRQMLGLADLEASSWRADLAYSFISAANEQGLKTWTSHWSVRPERIAIDTARHTGPPVGRAATPGDSARIVELLNGTHQREELFVAYTAESLAVRLGRQPDLYSWKHLRIGERAVLGVWPAHIRVLKETGGETTTETRALVLDYGYEEGAEDELVALLQSACGELVHTGTTELTIFVTPQSTTYSRLASLAKLIEPYVLHILVSEPGDLATRGIYVDQLYL